jgi:hypothetical protein
MEEAFEDYLQRLKDRRTEDDYKYTDEDFEKYERYIRDCCKNGMSVYKCLELMYFAKKDMDDQLFNREPKQETLEEVAEIWVNNRFTKQIKDEDIYASKSSIIESHILFAKWQQERSYSEEEVKDMVSKTVEEFCVHLKDSFRKAVTVEWFEQIKKK